MSPPPPRPARAASLWDRTALDVGTTLLMWLAAASFFFRAEWTSGFRHGMGDNHDTVQLTYLQEHWYHVLRGQASWQNPGIFYPLKGVLGWSDGLVLFQIFYAPLRLLGCDIFLAAQITVILFSLVGYVSFVYLARVGFRVERRIAAVSAIAFTFANNLWLHLYWTQLLTVWMVVGILLLVALSFRYSRRYPVRSIALGAAGGLSGALAFFTDFYVAWFSTIAIGVAALILLLGGRVRTVNWILRHLRVTWWLVLTVGLIFVAGLVPFAVTYLPAQRTVHHLDYGTIMHVAPRLQDLVSIGTGNVLWFPVVRHVLPLFDLQFSALDYAVTPVVMAFAVLGSALAYVVSKRELRTGAQAEGPGAGRAAIVLGATALVLAILPLRTHFGSLWAVVWHLPGATAVRRTGRIGVVTGLVASLAMACAATVLYQARCGRPYRSVRRLVIGVLLVVAVVEQVNTTPEAGLNRSADLAFLHSAHAPPSGCRSFYVLDRFHTFLSPATTQGYFVAVSDQIEAMLISEQYLIPTINGYTSYAPQGWDLLDPYAPGYLGAVRSWAEKHRLQGGLCQLDLLTMRWQSGPVLRPGRGST